MKDKTSEMVLMKIEVKMAYEEYKERYKKVPAGLTKLKTQILLSTDHSYITMLKARFFGNITKSLNAKKRNE